MIAALGGALGVGPTLAQAPAPAAAPAPATAAATGSATQDMSRTGAARKDTIVLRPKDGDTLSIRLPVQGQVFINSQIPWAVTGGKESKQLRVFYDVRGIEVQHTGSEGGAKASFSLRLIDGRKITVNVRTVPAKYKVGYAIIT
jgi:hypothetical protein